MTGSQAERLLAITSRLDQKAIKLSRDATGVSANCEVAEILTEVAYEIRDILKRPVLEG